MQSSEGGSSGLRSPFFQRRWHFQAQQRKARSPSPLFWEVTEKEWSRPSDQDLLDPLPRSLFMPLKSQRPLKRGGSHSVPGDVGRSNGHWWSQCRSRRRGNTGHRRRASRYHHLARPALFTRLQHPQ